MHTIAGLEMARFEMNVSLLEVAWIMGLQGFGVGWLWVPMTLVTFSNLDPRRSAEGAALFHFVRSVASSFYISARSWSDFDTQKDQLRRPRPMDQSIQHCAQAANGDGRLEHRARQVAEIADDARQATNICYINSFNLYLWTSLLSTRSSR